MLKRTDEQESICAAIGAGENTMVNALAGCAKSTTIIESLRDAPKAPTTILAFNKKIKEEMEKKIKSAGLDRPDLRVQTMNGLGHGALMKTLGRINLDNDKIFNLAKDTGVKGDDLADLMYLTRTGRNLGIVPKGSVGDGLLEDTLETWEGLAEDNDIDPILATLARDVLKKSVKAALGGTIDFDDQIYISTLIAGSYPKTELVYVDEAQDLSPLNHIQLRKTAKRQLVAVGDPHQAIYAWRGADSASMRNLRALREGWADRNLSTTFRCPRVVVERQRDFVPLFKAGPNNLPGHVSFRAKWTPVIGSASAIICRNNAPLIKLAFRFLNARVPINFLGKDIGRDMKRFYNKLSHKGKLSTKAVLEKIEALMYEENADVDRLESLRTLLEADPNIDSALQFLTDSKSAAIVLSTGHKAKGMEWENVYFLHPELIPSKYAQAVQGPALEQEHNLRYVIETRTKNNLFLVRSDGLDL